MLNNLDIPEIVSISRNTLYYNEFKYRASIYITGANLTRKAKNIEEYIEFANYLQNRNLIKQDSLLFSETIETMKRFFSLCSSGYRFIKRIERNTVTFFFNDVEFLNLIVDVAPIEHNIEVVEHYDVGRLYIRNPKYKYRTYIKAFNYQTDKETLKTFVDYADKISGIRCSKSIGYAVNSKTKSSFSGYRYYYYFRAGHIDYNDENFISIIGIYLGPMIKKTVELVEKPK